MDWFIQMNLYTYSNLPPPPVYLFYHTSTHSYSPIIIHIHKIYPLLQCFCKRSSLKELWNCILCIFVSSYCFIYYRFRQVCIFYLFFWKTSLSSFCIFCVLAYSVFRFHLHKLYQIYIIIFYIGVRYSVILFSLY